jgi:glycosyltransferase involved in cell wall biosynthesis
MRVALDVSAVPAQPAGAGVYVLRLVEALAAAGEVELDLVARRDDGVRWATLAARARVWAAAPERRPVRLAWEQTGAPRLARKLRPDVWHGPHYTMPLRVRPAVVTIHDLTFFDHPEWHERSKVPYFRSMIRASAARAAGLVCVSRYTAERLAAVVRPRVPVAVVPHGVDHERFTPEPHPGDGDRLVVLAGKPGWGVDEVEAALAGAPALEGRVVRTGYVDDPTRTALLRGASVVAYPSLEEGFGLPVLEALAVGAVVVTTTGSAMEEVADGAALLVPPGDEAALAGALEAVLAGGPDVERRREAGPRTAAPYTWEASAAGHLKTYAEAAG